VHTEESSACADAPEDFSEIEMTHSDSCKGAYHILERRRVPETGETVYQKKCIGCGAVEELTAEEADKQEGRGGYFIPTREP
jgi:hypothetical protein